jgi:hypothetical protein
VVEEVEEIKVRGDLEEEVRVVLDLQLLLFQQEHLL